MMRPLLHVAITLAFQIVAGLLTGDFLTGGVFAVGAFFGREIRQAQELYLLRTGKNVTEANIWLLFLPKAWTFDSLVMDLVLPAISTITLYWFTRLM